MKKFLICFLLFSTILFSQSLKGVKWVWLDGNASGTYDTQLTATNGDTTEVDLYTTTTAAEYPIHEAMFILQYGTLSRIKPSPDYEWSNNLLFTSRDTTKLDSIGVFPFTSIPSRRLIIAYWKDTTGAQSVPLVTSLPLLKLHFKSTAVGKQWIKIISPTSFVNPIPECTTFFNDKATTAGKIYEMFSTSLLITTE